jgi:hypothetical protein
MAAIGNYLLMRDAGIVPFEGGVSGVRTDFRNTREFQDQGANKRRMTVKGA